MKKVISLVLKFYGILTLGTALVAMGIVGLQIETQGMSDFDKYLMFFGLAILAGYPWANFFDTVIRIGSAKQKRKLKNNLEGGENDISIANGVDDDMLESDRLRSLEGYETWQKLN